MWRKAFALLLSLGFVLGANMDLCCSVAVNGQELEGLYSPFAADKSMEAAAAAAEEILEVPAVLPKLKKHYRLSFYPAEGDARVISDAALRSVSGVRLADGVFVNGVYMGSVEDGDELFLHLREFILNQMPNAAVFGNISGKATVEKIYSRSSRMTDYDDMVLLISGMAPVIYVDENGKLV